MKTVLSAISTLRPGSPWSEIQHVFRTLGEAGFCASDHDDSTEAVHNISLQARDVILSRRDAAGEEMGLAYFGLDAAGLLHTANVSWRLEKSTSTDTFEEAARSLFAFAGDVLGPTQGMLFDAPEGLSSSGDENVVVAQAYWPLDGRTGAAVPVEYRGHGDHRLYREALLATPNAATLWLVADSYHDGAALTAMFSVVRSR